MGALDGKPLFDYIISDNTITPVESAQSYAEKLILLPCYQPVDTKRPQTRLLKRTDYFLPEDAFVFCSFNQSFKISENIFLVWMRLLKQVPDSVLWLLDCNALAKANLIKTAEAQGLSANRLVFAPREPFAKHLARHQLADLMLDTLPYNAHTTASDAVWGGLPLLTVLGDTFAGRVAASILSAANLTELITCDLAEYEAKALYFAQNRTALAIIKQKMADTKKTMPLFDTYNFTKKLEAHFKMIWQAYLLTKKL